MRSMQVCKFCGDLFCSHHLNAELHACDSMAAALDKAMHPKLTAVRAPKTAFI